MSDRILVVDDETSICELIKIELELEGYTVETANKGDEALEKFQEFSPDIVLLDLMLPGISGYELCVRFRQERNVPIIMLTALSESEDIVKGLDLGADDYVTKPFDMRVLLARIRALIKRYKNTSGTRSVELRNGLLAIYPESQNAFVGRSQVKLTATEFELLQLFMENVDKVFSRQDIAEKIGITDFEKDTRSIDMHIQRLRRKLGKHSDATFIETVFGRGYKMGVLDEA